MLPGYIVMADKDKPTKDGSSKEADDLHEYGNKAAKDLFKPEIDSDFDENELVSGSADLIEKTDAELFPDEIEEYTSKEKKPRVIVDNDKKKSK